MAKFALTVNSDDPSEIAALLAALGGQATVEDDETGPVNALAPQVDSAGMPWDERIHAKSKGVKADGTWKRARGATDESVAAVEAEHRAKNASPIPAGNVPASSPSPAQPNFPAQPATNVHTPGADPAFTPAPPTTPQPAAQITPPNFTAPMPEQPAQTPAQPAGIDFNGLMTGLQKAMQAQKLDMAGLGAAVADINAAWNSSLQQVTDLVQHPHMIEWVKTYFEQRGQWVA